MTILGDEKLDLREMIVVSVPEPAMSGNAIGTILPALVSDSALKNSSPSTISSPIKNITIEPAIANDLMSKPRKLRKVSPTKRNTIIRNPEAIVAFPDSILPSFSFKETKIGIEPGISITAKSVKLTVKI